MSVKASSWAWSLTELPQAPTLALLAMADIADDDGFLWPSQDHLAMKARMTVRSFQRALRFLRDAGLVDVTVRASAGGRKSNLYRLHLDAELSLQNNQSDNLSSWVEDSDGQPVDNPETRWESTNATNCRVGSKPVDNSTQHDTSDVCLDDTSDVLLPYGELNHQLEPSLPPTPHGDEDALGAAEASRTDGGPGRPSIRSVGSPPSASSPPAVGEDVARPSSADRDLITECLPEPMRFMPSSGVTAVAARLRALVAAGWRPDELRKVLASQALPDEVRSMPHLVLYRLNDVDVDGAPAARAARRERDEQLLEECVPAVLWPLRGPGRDELADYLRGFIVDGRLAAAEIREVLGDYPLEAGHPSCALILKTLRALGVLEAAVERRGGA